MWLPVIGACKQYYWYFELPHGWTACVADESQASEPERTTNYTFSAICKPGVIFGPIRVYDFESAKRMALDLALSQPPLTGKYWDDNKIFLAAFKAHELRSLITEAVQPSHAPNANPL